MCMVVLVTVLPKPMHCILFSNTVRTKSGDGNVIADLILIEIGIGAAVRILILRGHKSNTTQKFEETQAE